jgi:HrpA-like RNA helicase
VILATNIAESSVTIPGVAYVIDSCRSLQVYWDPIRKTDAAGLVWISQSQVSPKRLMLALFKVLTQKPTFDN